MPMPGLPFDEQDDDPVRRPQPPAVGRRPPASGIGRPSPALPAPLSRPGPGGSSSDVPDDSPLRSQPRRVLSVSDLTTAIRDRLEDEFQSIWVEGELSNCKVWNTGHLYFTLKDERSQVRGVMFRTALRYLRFKPADGLKVIARGRITVYEPKGEYQLTCEHLEPKGVGALQLAFEQLKKRLQAEGLFDASRKRPLPALPRCIGIVTSLDGAAIRDMLKVLSRRHHRMHVVVRPARVQGDGAAAEIARGIVAVSRLDTVDVVIVGRGGGSIEDLWAFNEEVVARAIAASPVPVISAVGHETDVTIADFVADHRAPTPSAAAEIVVSAKDEFCDRIDRMRTRLDAAVRGRVQSLGRRVHMLSGRPALSGIPTRVALRGREVTELTHSLARQVRQLAGARARRLAQVQRQLHAFDPGRRLATIRTQLATCDARLAAAVAARHHGAEARLRECAGRLESLSPLAVLGRGYAVAWDAARSRVLRRSDEVRPGDRITVTLATGELDCDVRHSR